MPSRVSAATKAETLAVAAASSAAPRLKERHVRAASSSRNARTWVRRVSRLYAVAGAAKYSEPRGDVIHACNMMWPFLFCPRSAAPRGLVASSL